MPSMMKMDFVVRAPVSRQGGRGDGARPAHVRVSFGEEGRKLSEEEGREEERAELALEAGRINGCVGGTRAGSVHASRIAEAYYSHARLPGVRNPGKDPFRRERSILKVRKDLSLFNIFVAASLIFSTDEDDPEIGEHNIIS
jgi:hypothetical protein